MSEIYGSRHPLTHWISFLVLQECLKGPTDTIYTCPRWLIETHSLVMVTYLMSPPAWNKQYLLVPNPYYFTPVTTFNHLSPSLGLPPIQSPLNSQPSSDPGHTLPPSLPSIFHNSEASQASQRRLDTSQRLDYSRSALAHSRH